MAIYVLGELRAPESVETIIPWLVPHPTQDAVRFHFRDLPATSPAHAALVKIGTPATRPLLDELKGNDSPEFRRACLLALVDIEGQELLKTLLSNEVAQSSSQLRSNSIGRLQEALSYLTTREQGTPNPDASK